MTGINNFTIKSETEMINKKCYDLEGDIILSSDKTQKIGELIGTIMLDTAKSTTFEILSVSVNDTNMKITSKNGSLTTKGVCARSIRPVRLFTPTTLELIPNPASDEVGINIQSSESGNFTLKIYSIEGVSIFSESWIKSDNVIRVIKLNLNDIESGAYQIFLESPFNIYPSPFS